VLATKGTHADTRLPMGGYVRPSCSTRGAHVHHCSNGTFCITPATCLPQPHQVVLSMYMVRVIRKKRSSWLADVLHESHAAFLHMMFLGIGKVSATQWRLADSID